ncbi:cyclin-O [Protopterus annectens]|uniref:cyclin-O n=1 Tax=Protopterus annectens TaxID=7888 RepID=UPI001CFBA37A|nr:cyclin-O [Protopterus annectens]
MVTCNTVSLTVCNKEDSGLPQQLSPGTKRKRSGLEDATLEDCITDVFGCSRAPTKKPRAPQQRKQNLHEESWHRQRRDSGFVDDWESPTPQQQVHPLPKNSSETEWESPALRGCGSPRREPPLSSSFELQNFTEYGQDWYQFKKKAEEKFHPVNCLTRQPQVTAEARCKLISWLIPVHRHFDFSFESLCLAVNIMDRFLVTTPVASDCFQLVGVTSLLIAYKQVEMCPPRINQLLALCCNAFTKDQMRNLECIILIKLNFDVAAPTLNFFLEHFTNMRLKKCNSCKKSSAEAVQAMSLARRMSELSLADYCFNKFLPSVLAISSLSLADQMLQHQSHIDSLTDSLSNEYAETVLNECKDKLKLLVSLNEKCIPSFSQLVLTEKISES